MLVAFTDESYSSKQYFQCALIVDENQLPSLDSLLLEAHKYSTQFGIDPNVEFHGHSIMSARKGWEPLAQNIRMKLAIYGDLVSRISSLRAVLLIQGVDITRLNARYSDPKSPHEITHKNLLDAIDRYAASVGELVTIYSDQIATQAKLRELFNDYRLNSTQGAFPRYLKNIQDIQYVESHHHSGIQIADLCVFLYRRYRSNEGSDPRTILVVENLWNELTPLINPNYLPRIWSP